MLKSDLLRTVLKHKLSTGYLNYYEKNITFSTSYKKMWSQTKSVKEKIKKIIYLKPWDMNRIRLILHNAIGGDLI